MRSVDVFSCSKPNQIYSISSSVRLQMHLTSSMAFRNPCTSASSSYFGLQAHALRRQLLQTNLPPALLISSNLQKCSFQFIQPRLRKSYSYWWRCSSFISSKLLLKIVMSELTPILQRLLSLLMIVLSWVIQTPTAPKRKLMYWWLKAPSSRPIRYTVRFSRSSFFIPCSSLSRSSARIGANLPCAHSMRTLDRRSSENFWKQQVLLSFLASLLSPSMMFCVLNWQCLLRYSDSFTSFSSSPLTNAPCADSDRLSEGSGPTLFGFSVYSSCKWRLWRINSAMESPSSACGMGAAAGAQCSQRELNIFSCELLTCTIGFLWNLLGRRSGRAASSQTPPMISQRMWQLTASCMAGSSLISTGSCMSLSMTFLGVIWSYLQMFSSVIRICSTANSLSNSLPLPTNAIAPKYSPRSRSASMQASRRKLPTTSVCSPSTMHRSRDSQWPTGSPSTLKIMPIT